MILAVAALMATAGMLCIGGGSFWLGVMLTRRDYDKLKTPAERKKNNNHRKRSKNAEDANPFGRSN